MFSLFFILTSKNTAKAGGNTQQKVIC